MFNFLVCANYNISVCGMINRSILSFHGENVKSVAGHTLLEPVQFKMNLSISLSPDVTSVPLRQLDANLGIVKVVCLFVLVPYVFTYM